MEHGLDLLDVTLPQLHALGSHRLLNITRELVLIGCGGEESGAALGPHLSKMTRLRTVVFEPLGSCPSHGFNALMPYVAEIASLKGLLVTNVQLSSADSASLASKLPQLSALTKMHFSDCGFGDEGLRALGPAIGTLTALQSLYLCSNGVLEEGADALGPYIAKLTALTDLWLSDKIGDEGIKSLAPHFANFGSLQCLQLQSCGIGPEGGAALVPHLSSLLELQSIQLQFNCIGATGAQAHAASIAHLQSLYCIDLEGNQIGDEGAKAAPHVEWHHR
jgi:Ran GTPase-activating protein (RanGAP) involved in mRNA processing and transport